MLWRVMPWGHLDVILSAAKDPGPLTTGPGSFAALRMTWTSAADSNNWERDMPNETSGTPSPTWGFATLAAHAGENAIAGEWQRTATPIYNASGFLMPSFDALDEVFDGTREGYYYTRDGNPTVRAFEAAVAALEGAPLVGAFASGMAAIHAALLAAGLKPGDTLLATRDSYGLTHVLLSTHFAELGIQTTFVDMTDLAAVEEALAARPRAIYLEPITNPLVKVLDLPSLIEMARGTNARVLVDNTFASPYLLRPIELGADFVIHSATKYLGGHGDVTGGTVAAAGRDDGRRLHYLAKLLGAVLGPNEAWLCHRGLKTLPLRMARQCDNALEIATWLQSHRRVARVLYPGLASHPQHELARRILPGRYGAMLAFDIRDGDRDAVRRFMDSLELVLPAPTLGDLRTLTLYPVQASHRGLTPEQRRAVGIGEGLVRLSAGIEEPADVIADLDQALNAVG
jgi:cystathionine beta-lyase/cystathionine gamma-synthase